MPRAQLVFSQKDVDEDGFIVEIRIWRLPAATIERPHGFKYSLFFGRSGERIVGYDNERGKGDHRHVGGLEAPYRFVSLGTLVEDFERDVKRLRST